MVSGIGVGADVTGGFGSGKCDVSRSEVDHAVVVLAPPDSAFTRGANSCVTSCSTCSNATHRYARASSAIIIIGMRPIAVRVRQAQGEGSVPSRDCDFLRSFQICGVL